MKLVSFNAKMEESYGVVKEAGESIWNLAGLERSFDGEEVLPTLLLHLIQEEQKYSKRLKELVRFGESLEDQTSCIYLWKDVTLLPPIPKPAKNIMCVGKNYREHAIEMGSEADIPEHIMIFTKAPTSVTGSMTAIQSHESLTSQLDYEGELAVIIGKKGINISEEEAPEHIFGYTILNDITARDLQKKHKQFFLGKSLDTTCPIGPFIVTADEIKDPETLTIKTVVNGEVRQEAPISDMIFPIAKIISELSAGMTLEPGDIIATGTPSGVGKGFKPPRFLKSGDKIEISIDRIGTLANTIQ
ncbi:fumarylacetoacetate hydrolase family protein [Rossellomorea vietnamensis]|uniref:Fumarylacetoacetate hydrolase family protein n=2 Tax=Bacillaceae TaxID=186817 RepID=A0A5D4MEL4_9BACI|nr:fumarylacetoacetate hydrolase family protein [Rossellomorea vietnamensis]TYR99465.1 fumarylacetoacetate hydrolase family protein [Rossellomorea vietnamensis]